MRLLLTSSGITNKTIENALQQVVEKPFKASRIVFIPTAANVEEDISGWLENDINNFRKLQFSSFDVIDIANEKSDIFMPILSRTDILVFGGGNEVYLLDQIRRVGLDTFLQGFVQKNVYVGISAGSMIAAKTLSLNDSGKLYYENFKRTGQISGLGFVNFEIRPHLNSTFFEQVRIPVLQKIAPEIDHEVYAIDDDTAIKVIGNNVFVVSEGEWKKFN